MTGPEKTARAVLAAAALVDHRIREPDASVIRAWAHVLGDVELPRALHAVARHYRSETRVLLPADVLDLTIGEDPDRSPAYRPMREVLAELDTLPAELPDCPVCGLPVLPADAPVDGCHPTCGPGDDA